MNVCVKKYSNNKIHNSVGYVIRSPQTCPGCEITHSVKGLGILLPVTAALIGQTPCYWMLQPALCRVAFVVSTCVDANSASCVSPQLASEPVGEPHRGEVDDAHPFLSGS